MAPVGEGVGEVVSARSQTAPGCLCWTGHRQVRSSADRRRGFRTKRKTQAALNDAVAALSAKTYVPPSSQRLGLFPSDSWLPAVQTRGPLPFAAASAS